MESLRSIPKTLLIAVVVGFVVGVLWLAAIRFLTIASDDVHYHANFALYVNDEQHIFDNFTFYEEIQSCGGGALDPKTRVHMHDEVNHVVHVHDSGVTWGHFFANLGYNLGNEALTTDDGVFVDGQDNKKLIFILNGEEIGTVANREINSGDVLLVDYGSAGARSDLMERYEEITADAEEYNQKDDPSACAGGTELTAADKLRRALGIGQ